MIKDLEKELKDREGVTGGRVKRQRKRRKRRKKRERRKEENT